MAYKASLAQETMLLELRDYHKASGLSLRELEEALGWANAKASKILRGKQGASLADLNGLMEVLKVPRAERTRLRKLRTQSRVKQVWWDAHPWISEEFGRYLALEDAAVSICTVQSVVFPGLLQIPEYMEKLFESSSSLSRVVVQDAVDVRRKRQEILEKHTLKYTAILAPGILQTGPPEILRKQLKHTIELAERPNVDICVISKDYIVSSSDLGLLVLPGGRERAATDTPLLGALVLDDPAQVRRVRRAIESYKAHALDPEESVKLMSHMLREVRE
jgi:transcriptional regulator with XRE-family HTH domain